LLARSARKRCVEAQVVVQWTLCHNKRKQALLGLLGIANYCHEHVCHCSEAAAEAHAAIGVITGKHNFIHETRSTL